MNHKPSSPSIETLLPIWQRVLQRSSIRASDNFFDLGGTPSSASKLFSEISAAFGRDFPAVMICAAPTVETLAVLLQNPAPPRFPPLALLKPAADPSGACPPVFIAHGLGGDVLGLLDLVVNVESRHSFYGLQARGIDGIDEPLPSIEARAQYHLSAIRQLQPHGPYFLIGFSLGGLLTLEIAQRLSAGGEKIALLALLDSYPHRSQLSNAQYLRLTIRLAERAIGALINSAFGSPRPQSGDAEENLFQGNDSEGIRRVMQRMREADYLAWRTYRPQFYRGRIRFVKAETISNFPDNPLAVWSSLAEKFEVETAPGDHVGMITTYSKNLGSVLSRYLEESSQQPTEG